MGATERAAVEAAISRLEFQAKGLLEEGCAYRIQYEALKQKEEAAGFVYGQIQLGIAELNRRLEEGGPYRADRHVGGRDREAALVEARRPSKKHTRRYTPPLSGSRKWWPELKESVIAVLEGAPTALTRDEIFFEVKKFPEYAELPEGTLSAQLTNMRRDKKIKAEMKIGHSYLYENDVTLN